MYSKICAKELLITRIWLNTHSHYSPLPLPPHNPQPCTPPTQVPPLAHSLTHSLSLSLSLSLSHPGSPCSGYGTCNSTGCICSPDSGYTGDNCQIPPQTLNQISGAIRWSSTYGGTCVLTILLLCFIFMQ